MQTRTDGPSRTAYVERIEVAVAAQVIDHFYRCPDCNHVVITMATRPWRQWCRQCKTHVEPPPSEKVVR